MLSQNTQPPPRVVAPSHGGAPTPRTHSRHSACGALTRLAAARHLFMVSISGTCIIVASRCRFADITLVYYIMHGTSNVKSDHSTICASVGAHRASGIDLCCAQGIATCAPHHMDTAPRASPQSPCTSSARRCGADGSTSSAYAPAVSSATAMR